MKSTRTLVAVLLALSIAACTTTGLTTKPQPTPPLWTSSYNVGYTVMANCLAAQPIAGFAGVAQIVATSLMIHAFSLRNFAVGTVYSKTEKVRIDVLKRFGVYSTESNGHLSEYLPWYRKRPEEITRWIDMSDWIHGETGGYLRYSTENRNWFEEDFPKFLDEAGGPLSASKKVLTGAGRFTIVSFRVCLYGCI